MKLVDLAKLYHRVLIYGVPKSGKTRLALAYPESWGLGVYVAADLDGEALASVIPANKAKVTGAIVKPGPNEGKPADPYFDSIAVAVAPWEGRSVLIWDTLSATAQDILRHFAKQGMFASEQITYGKVGTPSHLAHPTMGDYGAAQSAVSLLLGHLLRREMHLIVICHADIAEPKAGKPGTAIGGPSSVGTAQIKELAGRFSSLIHLEAGRKREEKDKPAVERITAFCSPHSLWLAGVRSGKSAPMADVILNQDPTNFWERWHEHTQS